MNAWGQINQAEEILGKINARLIFRARIHGRHREFEADNSKLSLFGNLNTNNCILRTRMLTSSQFEQQLVKRFCLAITSFAHRLLQAVGNDCMTARHFDTDAFIEASNFTFQINYHFIKRWKKHSEIICVGDAT